jgi:hypothetical protein
MRLDLEWDETELDLKYIYGPSMVDRGKWHSPGWLIYARAVKCPTYYGAFGVGATPQLALAHALTQLRDYVARYPQGVYNTMTTSPSIVLDLSDLDF